MTPEPRNEAAEREALARIAEITKAFDISMSGEETFLALAPPRVKQIRDIARAALAAERAAPKVERFDRSWWHYADDCPVAPLVDAERLREARRIAYRDGTDTATEYARLAGEEDTMTPEPQAPHTVRAELWYPRNDSPESVDTIRVSLLDVRAADDIIIRYDFDRDGYSISQPTIHEWRVDDEECDEGLIEVAFVPAWYEAEVTA